MQKGRSRLILRALAIACAAVPCSSAPPSQDPPEPPALGLNLAGVADWSSQWVFVDVFRHARAWIPQKPVGGPWNTGEVLELTPQGWPLLKPDQAAGTLMCRDLDGHYPGGVYTCLYEGSGAIELGFDAHTISQEPGLIRIQVSPASGGIYLKIVASDPADPVRDIRVIMPGFEQSFQAQVFHPLFLERLEGFGGLRFMDWQRTNGSVSGRWSRRATLDYFSQATERGVALEHLIDLANRLDANPWFCMPHKADDDYVRGFAEMVRARLDPELSVFVEYSNEVWNGQFAQGDWCQERGLALGLSTDPYQARLFYQSLRSVEIFAIWEGVLGAASDRLVRVLASQSANPWTGIQVMDFQDAWMRADALAVAPYFGGHLGTPAHAAATVQMSVDEVLDECVLHLDEVASRIATNRGEARRRGLGLLAYEGGQHLVGVGSWQSDPTLMALFFAANRHPRMRALYLDYLGRWSALGGGAFQAFSSCGLPSQYGSWGALEWQDQPMRDAPKYRALREVLGGDG